MNVCGKIFVYDAKTCSLTLLSEREDEKKNIIIGKIEQNFKPSVFQQIVPNENEIENLVLNKFEEYIPRKFTIEVTEKCTLRCKYCLFSNQLSERHHSEIEMDDLTMQKAVDYYYLIYTSAFKRVSNRYREEVLSIAPPGISWWGGEPFTNFELIKKSKAYIESLPWHEYGIEKDKFVYSVVSNFTIVNDEILDFLISNKIYLFVSLDGGEKEHDKNRVFTNNQGSFSRVSHNIDILIRKAPEYCKKYMVIQAVLANNIRGNQGVNSIIKTYGIYTLDSKVLNFQLYPQKVKNQYLPGKRKRMNEKKELADFDFLLNQLNSMPAQNLVQFFKIQKGILNEIENLFALDGKIAYENSQSCGIYKKWLTCPAGVDNIFVSVTGDIHICNKSDYSFKLGDVSTGISLNRIKRFYSQYYDIIRNGKCHSCWAVHFCGICPAALLNDGKFHLPNDEECEIVKKNICLQLKKYIMLLNRDELYEKLETAILNLPKRTFLNYREPLNIRLYEKD